MKPFAFSTFIFACANLLITTAYGHHGAWVFDVVPGSITVDASRIAPYSARWAQLSRQDGELVDSGTVFEETLRAEDGVLRHIQTVSSKTGVTVQEVRLLDARTLQALALDRELQNGPPDRSKSISLKLTGSDYAGAVVMADGTSRPFSYTTPLPAFDGWIAGLVLAALPLKTGYQATLPAVVQLQQATYQLHIAVQEQRNHDVAPGLTVPVWVVDSTWINVADGSASPGGAEQSGGTYYMAVEPGNGVPSVVEYANDSAVIRWLP